jgi:DNA-binding Lrp family transcriptional regulator
MDKLDYDILRIVQNNSRLTAEVISNEVNLSPAAVQKRLKNLRDSGVIKKEVAILSAKHLERNLTIITNVVLERENIASLNEFKLKMREASCVQQCYYVTGEFAFVLILLVHDMEEYERFTQEYFFAESNMVRFTTMVVMNEVKTSLNVI